MTKKSLPSSYRPPGYLLMQPNSNYSAESMKPLEQMHERELAAKLQQPDKRQTSPIDLMQPRSILPSNLPRPQSARNSAAA